MEKMCARCGASPTRRDARRAQSYCQKCQNEYARQWRASKAAQGILKKPVRNPENRARWEAEYNKRPEVIARRAEKMREYMADPKKREKQQARLKLWDEVRNGRIIPKPCEVCGAAKTQGHHEDYAKPLDVIWLCKKHHIEHHAKSEGR